MKNMTNYISMNHSEKIRLNKEKYEGVIFSNDKFGDVIVLEYFGCMNVKAQFLESGHIFNTQIGELKRVRFRDPCKKILFGVACIGIGVFETRKNNKTVPIHRIWRDMIRRGYDPKYKAKRKSYEHVIVCKDWLNYQNFAAWASLKYVENWDLDKDLLSSAFKIYSPETCCFLPPEINQSIPRILKSKLPTGVDTRNNKTFSIRITIDGIRINKFGYKRIEDASIAYLNLLKEKLSGLAEKYKSNLDVRAYEKLKSFDFPKFKEKQEELTREYYREFYGKEF